MYRYFFRRTFWIGSLFFVAGCVGEEYTSNAGEIGSLSPLTAEQNQEPSDDAVNTTSIGPDEHDAGSAGAVAPERPAVGPTPPQDAASALNADPQTGTAIDPPPDAGPQTHQGDARVGPGSVPVSVVPVSVVPVPVVAVPVVAVPIVAVPIVATMPGPQSGLPCGAPGVLACEDFEEGIEQHPTTGDVEVTTDRSHRGQRSLKASTGEAGERASLWVGFGEPLRDTTLYSRAYFFIPEDQPVVHISLMELGNCAVVGGANGTGIWCGADSMWSLGAMRVPEGRWFCLRWVHQLGVLADSSVYIDDEFVVGHTGIETSGTEAIDGIRFPATYTNETQPAIDVFVDDVVVSTFELKCGE